MKCGEKEEGREIERGDHTKQVKMNQKSVFFNTSFHFWGCGLTTHKYWFLFTDLISELNKKCIKNPVRPTHIYNQCKLDQI